MAELEIGTASGDVFSLPSQVAVQTTAILGIRGSGKTNTAVVITEELLDQGHQVVVVDPLDVWWGLKSSADGAAEGYGVVVLGGPHADLPLSAEDGRPLADFAVEERVPLILSLRHLRKNKQRSFVTDFCEQLYHRKGEAQHRRPLLVVIDEASSFIPQKVGAGTARMVGAVEDLVRRGRAAGIGVVAIDQRAASVNKDVLTQLEVLVAHRHTSPQDRKALDEWVRAHDTEGLRERFLADLASLELGQAYVWSPLLGVFELVRVRMRRTFDSSKTPELGDEPALPQTMATVDLEALRERLSSTIEQARAEDPKLLRERIAELEAQLEAETSGSAGEERWKAECHRLTKKMYKMEAAHDERLQLLASTQRQASAAAAALKKALAEVEELAQVSTYGAAGRVDAKAEPSEGTEIIPKTHVEPAQETPAPVLDRAARDELGSPQQKILDALATYESFGQHVVDRTAAAALAGYRPGSGHVNNTIGSLHTAGLIEYPKPGFLALTDSGRAVARARSIRTIEDVHAAWFSILSGPQEKILQVLTDFYPESLHRDELAERAGYTPGTGHFNNVVGSLRTLGAAEYPQQGYVQASPLLFPNGFSR